MALTIEKTKTDSRQKSIEKMDFISCLTRLLDLTITNLMRSY